MNRGKYVCKTLKEIRRQVAQANDIPYEPADCHHEGECPGTCPRCEQEVRYIEGQLLQRRRLGKAVTVAGVSVGLAALSACITKKPTTDVPPVLQGEPPIIEYPQLTGIPPLPDEESRPDTVILQREVTPASMVVRTDTLSEDVLLGDVVDPMPQFPGGNSRLMEFLTQNMRYPEQAVKDSIQGRVVLSFVVEKDGSIADAKVVRNVHPLLDEEALRVLQSMPKWIPAEVNGKPVRVRYALPLSFKL